MEIVVTLDAIKYFYACQVCVFGNPRGVSPSWSQSAAIVSKQAQIWLHRFAFTMSSFAPEHPMPRLNGNGCHQDLMVTTSRLYNDHNDCFTQQCMARKVLITSLYTALASCRAISYSCHWCLCRWTSWTCSQGRTLGTTTIRRFERIRQGVHGCMYLMLSLQQGSCITAVNVHVATGVPTPTMSQS